ncbi:MAG: nucleoside hydrolase [Clostridia bacterium]|nr:nucleoside hydrolase [Clostridia bacterium]MBQ9803201.1 nucleoside hydrolase [Clostridia bacterium]
MKKVLFDTDIGNDIDDSLALAYLLSEPDCALMGVTTVSGAGQLRAGMVDAICRRAGRTDIPIYPGVEQPLLGTQRQPYPRQAERLGRWAHRESFPEGGAIEFMRRTIRENPGEISLLAVGPMTNIALLFSIDREIPHLLKELVLMCGDVLRDGVKAEWNAICDPLAAAIVYGTEVPVHRSVGLNVTEQVTMDKAEMEKHFTAPVLEPVRDFAGVWFEHRSTMVYHDPLAAMTLFDDRVCSFKTGSAELVLPGSPDAGKLRFCEGEGYISVADSVDAPYAINKYLKTVNKGS